MGTWSCEKLVKIPSKRYGAKVGKNGNPWKRRFVFWGITMRVARVFFPRTEYITYTKQVSPFTTNADWHESSTFSNFS